MERINEFFSGLLGSLQNDNRQYRELNDNDNDTNNDSEKVIDIWAENDPLMESVDRCFPGMPKKIDESTVPMPRMVSIAGHTYVSLNDTLCEYEKIERVHSKVLTAKNYLKKDWRKNLKYLDFVDQTYTSHMKERMKYCRKALKASFYLFINAFFPNKFTYRGTDIIIFLGEDILDKYFEVLNKQAEKITAEV